MYVSVNLLGQLRVKAQTDKVQIPLHGHTQVADIFQYMKENYSLPLSENTIMITVNDEVSRMSQNLKADDSIAFLPLLGGG